MQVGDALQVIGEAMGGAGVDTAHLAKLADSLFEDEPEDEASNPELDREWERTYREE